ncbi:hypothetical protein J6590_107596, partial [Homalodisca vitripennis]
MCTLPYLSPGHVRRKVIFRWKVSLTSLRDHPKDLMPLTPSVRHACREDNARLVTTSCQTH